ncbi:MAG TPA: SH3 domain-containing protein [Pyrinomonadaceae bacterium]|jgi:SH3-like domain-containing protein
MPAMKKMLAASLCAAALAALVSAGRAAPAAPGAAAPAACKVEAYVVDKDPGGLNVRDAPGPAGKVVAVIPLDEEGTTVNIVASSPNGWVQIERAETVMGSVVFDGKGWVSGNMLGVSTRGYGTKGVRLYAAAGRGKAVGTIPPEAEARVAGCSGGMMRVRYKNLTGWLEPDAQCASPVTNCN